MQLPILYNSEKKAKSVECKIEDMRSRLCFCTSGHSGVPVNARGNRSISSNSPAQLEIKDMHDERSEIWMSLITCGSIQGHEWFSDDSLGRRDFCVWMFYYVSNFAAIRE